MTLSPHDKRRLLSELARLRLDFGDPPLTNVSVDDLRPADIDVVAVGALVYRKDGTTVLVRRAETPTEWIIPGGTVDAGEDLVNSAIREVYEETGLETEIDGLLRIGIRRDYGPQAFRQVNKERFGKEEISLFFVNFRAKERNGSLDHSRDPSANILEVRAFRSVPFANIAHVYKVLFVEQGLWDADLRDYPPVEFDSPAP